MPNEWRQAYKDLTDFMAKHSEIEVRLDAVSIPEDVRPEFYRLFDTARTEFLEENIPDLLDEGKTLSQSYLKAEEEVTKLLGLDEVTQPKPLHWFLQDATDGLRRELFHLLLDLVKRKIDIETFEEEALRNLKTSFGAFYRLGYKKWTALSLIKLLDADRLLQVILRPFERSERTLIKVTDSEEEVPDPQESRHLSFYHEPEWLFIVPDFIVHSAKVDRYIALRTEMDEAISGASNASEKREWYPLASVAALEPGLVPIYVADKPEEISLVADSKRICRPDLVIECKEQRDWYDKEGLEKVKLHHDSLKPRLGTYVVSREPVPEQAFQELVPQQVSKEPALEQGQEPAQEQEPEKRGQAIHILTVGFDQSKLEPLINILTNQEDRGQ